MFFHTLKFKILVYFFLTNCFSDQEAVGSNEPLKRQRRWNSESLKLPEQQSSNLTPTSTPRDSFQSSALKRNLSRSNSALSEDTLKERVGELSISLLDIRYFSL